MFCLRADPKLGKNINTYELALELNLCSKLPLIQVEGKQML